VALSPSITRVAGVSQTYASGYPAAAAVAEVAQAPLAELDARAPLSRDAFHYSDFAPEQKRSRPDQTLADSDRPRRRMVGSLLSTSTESFSLAFAQHPQFNVMPSAPGGANTKATVQRGIETYEMTSAVIHNELAPRGENVSITL
jgi:hypothetical protein